MADFVVILILVLLIGGAVRYIVKAKKRGAKCIGCGSSGSCCSCSSCSTNGKNENKC